LIALPEYFAPARFHEDGGLAGDFNLGSVRGAGADAKGPHKQQPNRR
jgi:hypothetical protein